MNTPAATLQTIFKRTNARESASITLSQAKTQKPDHEITVDIVMPVYNEATTLNSQITKLRLYLNEHIPYMCTVIIADNGSTDATWEQAKLLAAEPGIRALHLDQKGRGRALKAAWSGSSADILAYMDLDLSTDLDSLAPLLVPLTNGSAQIATGSRLQRKSRVGRSFKREFLSRAYNYLLRMTLGLQTSDAQCGFKAVSAKFAKKILPQIQDDAWFFDTELLIKAEHNGEQVHEVAVSWQEDPDSRVNIRQTAIDDVKGIRRVRKELSNRGKTEVKVLAATLLATFLLYGFGALKNGYANSFYAAAVQAGTHSWKAFLFGSLDASNFITVDKPPFALWVMEISTRIFGFHSWSMMLPEVLSGVGTVYLVYAAVRRWFNAESALLAAALMALTPVAVLMFGFNNPDAVLTLLLTGSVYALIRALNSPRALVWLTLAAALTGSAFNTKMLQGLIVIPVLALVYLLAAKPSFMKRLKNLLITAVPLAIFALWWPLLVTITPASSRPYIGSSTNNSIWNLILGYNGVGRLLGDSSGMGGGSRTGGQGRTGGMGGGQLPTGASASTSSTSTTQSQSFTPPTGTGLGAGQTGAPTTGNSFGGQAPGGMGGTGRSGPGGSGFGGSTGILRMFNSDFGPNIAWFIPASLIMTGLVLWKRRRAARTDRTRTAFLIWGGYLLMHIIVFSMVSGVIHPYYPVVMAPAIAALIGMGLPILVRAYRRGGNAALLLPAAITLTVFTAFILLGYQASWLPWLRWLILTGGLLSAGGLVAYLYQPQATRLLKIMLVLGAISSAAAPVAYSIDTATVVHTGSIPSAGPTGTGMQGSNNEAASAESSLVSYLLAHQGSAKWIVAVDSANTSAAIQISSGKPVMAVGGFNGSDQAITLAGFKQLVASGQLKYYALSSGGRGGVGGGMGNSAILSWVESNGRKVAYGGSSYMLYQLKV